VGSQLPDLQKGSDAWGWGLNRGQIHTQVQITIDGGWIFTD
jgi:hypothetical protein